MAQQDRNSQPGGDVQKRRRPLWAAAFSCLIAVAGDEMVIELEWDSRE